MWVLPVIGALVLGFAVIGSIIFRKRDTKRLTKEIEAEIDDRVDGWVAQERQRRRDLTDNELYREITGEIDAE